MIEIIHAALTNALNNAKSYYIKILKVKNMF